MYLDHRLWTFTQGVRLRIAASVALGLLAAASGVARLALLGWLLSKVFVGQPIGELILPFALTAAVMVLRGLLELSLIHI